MPKILDIVIWNRFKIWFNSDAAQAGYKTSQGCMVQIFVIVLFIELANWANMTLFLGLMDYEKAFDFINRADLVYQLMLKVAGKRFVRTVTSLYNITTYKQNIDPNNIGVSITTRYGVSRNPTFTASR